MGKNKREHGLLLFLNPTLTLSLVKLQADRNLGRSYAGLLALAEGLYQLGYLDKANHDQVAEKYSIPLIPQEMPTPADFPRCDFCSQPSIATFQNVASNRKRRTCLYHTSRLASSQKWKKIEVAAI